MVVANESPEPDPELLPYQRSVYKPNDNSRDSSSLHDDSYGIGNGDENGIERNGPIAEALIQNEQMFHHLKILKPSPSETENQRRKSALVPDQLEKQPPRKVYSQVYKSNLKKNDIFDEKLFVCTTKRTMNCTV